MKFIHMSDLHASSDTLPECLTILEQIITIGEQENIHFLIHTGDFWDRALINNESAGLLGFSTLIRRALKSFAVFAIYGTPSHDVAGSLGFLEALSDNHPIKIFNAPTSYRYQVKNPFPPTNINIVGFPWTINMSQWDVQDVVTQLRTLKQQQEAKTAILLMHTGLADVDGCFPEYAMPAIKSSDLMSLGYAYTGLGHIHIAHHPQLEQLPIRYGGSLRHVTHGEIDDKGFRIIELDLETNVIVKEQFVKTASIPVITLTTLNEVLNANVRGMKVRANLIVEHIESLAAERERIRKILLEKGAIDAKVVLHKTQVPLMRMNYFAAQSLKDEILTACQTLNIQTSPEMLTAIHELEQCVVIPK